MTLYVLDEDHLTGVKAIDDRHRRIAELSRELIELYDHDAPLRQIRETFEAWRAVMEEHFAIEERLLEEVAREHDIRRHLEEHKANHQKFRDTFVYVAMKFDEAQPGDRPPNIVPLIPAKYFDELKHLDHEMHRLFRRYGVS